MHAPFPFPRLGVSWLSSRELGEGAVYKAASPTPAPMAAFVGTAGKAWDHQGAQGSREEKEVESQRQGEQGEGEGTRMGQGMGKI